MRIEQLATAALPLPPPARGGGEIKITAPPLAGGAASTASGEGCRVRDVKIESGVIP
jgi:hypothetical protein